MRILFLTNADVRQFGIAEALHGLSTALVRRGVHVLCYSSDASAKHSPLPNGVAVEYGALPTPRFFPSLGDVGALVRLCRREAIDLIHCHNLYRPGWGARLVKRALGIPYVLTSHNDVNPHTSDRIRRFWVRRRCRAIVRDAAMVTHLSAFMEDNARLLGDMAGKSCIIPNGLNLSLWPQPSEPAGNCVLALGRHVKNKGFDTLIEAASLLKRRGTPMSLILAGSGPEQPRLIALAAERGLAVRGSDGQPTESGSVWFTGVVAGETKRCLFERCRLVAFPSHANSESFGLVALEAMAAGRPVAASDLPTVREIVGDSSQLVPPGDPEAWAQALSRLLADDATCATLARANRFRALSFDWDVIAAQYLAVYERSVMKDVRHAASTLCTPSDRR
jgi:glycosyltransferase involved in cell wall biosynthesis